MVVNLAAGLDARPYRLTLPSHLQWIEVDLPDLLAYKTEQLARETPRCILERVALDLSNAAARRELFEQLSARAKAVIVVSEGLVVYLAPEQVLALAADFGHAYVQPVGARHGVAGAHADDAEDQDLRHAGALFKFAPDEDPAFFERAAWKTVQFARSCTPRPRSDDCRGACVSSHCCQTARGESQQSLGRRVSLRKDQQFQIAARIRPVISTHAR